jgi:hypothetical protein
MNEEKSLWRERLAILGGQTGRPDLRAGRFKEAKGVRLQRFTHRADSTRISRWMVWQEVAESPVITFRCSGTRFSRYRILQWPICKPPTSLHRFGIQSPGPKSGTGLRHSWLDPFLIRFWNFLIALVRFLIS